MPYADRAVPWYEPAAATAMRKCEERLRDLHPHAMARYDRLRADGMGPAEAMREAAPLFTRPPRVHDAHLHPAAGARTPRPPAGGAEHRPGPAPDPTPAPTAQAQERRGRQIIDALQEQARAQGRDPLGEAEQRTVLETVTNLPPAVIDRIVPARPGHRAWPAPSRTAPPPPNAPAPRTWTPPPTSPPRHARDERTQNLTGARDAAATADAATARAARAARPWERDFPMPIHDVVAASSRQHRPGALARAPQPPRRPATRRAATAPALTFPAPRNGATMETGALTMSEKASRASDNRRTWSWRHYAAARTGRPGWPRRTPRRRPGQRRGARAGADGAWTALVHLARREGFAAARGDCADGDAFTSWRDRRIHIRRDATPEQAITALAHQLGHVLLHGEIAYLGRSGTVPCQGIRKVEADSVAYLVAAHLGIDAPAITFPHVSSWAGTGPRAHPDATIQAVASRVLTAAAKITAAPRRGRPLPAAGRTSARPVRREPACQANVEPARPPASVPSQPPAGAATARR